VVLGAHGLLRRVKNLQAGIFGFGFPQWLEVRIGVFPKPEELPVVAKRGCGIA
jgi:hypothetical protein